MITAEGEREVRMEKSDALKQCKTFFETKKAQRLVAKRISVSDIDHGALIW